MISFPNAKINLGLDVIAKRSDGYHDIASCFYPIPLKDILEINLSDTFNLSTSGIPLQGDPKQNLIWKAYQLMKKDFNLPNVAMHLHKNIPLEAGLGGGSSDGAFTLRMLSEMFELFLEDPVLEDYAEKLGSDCPFFIYNKPALVRGRGEIIDDSGLDLSGYWLYLVKPDVAVSTSRAYRNLMPSQPSRDIGEIISQYPVNRWRDKLKNDFEKSVFEEYQDLARLKDAMYESGAIYASMTGSGSAIYGLFDEKPDKKMAIKPTYFTWEGEL